MPATPSTLPAEVRIANALTTARQTYSETQLNLFFCLLTKLRKEPAADLTYSFTLAELRKLMGKQLNPSNLAQQALAMQTSGWYCGSPEASQPLFLFDRVHYLFGQGIVEFTLSLPGLPFLFNITSQFTSFSPAAVLGLRGIYSKRLYLLCARWRDRPATANYTLGFLRWMFALTADTPEQATKYQLFGHLHAGILKPALQQLNAQTNFKVKLEKQKKARVVTGIRLLLRETPASMPIPSNEPSAAHSVTSRQVRAAEILEEFGIVASHLRNTILASEELIKATYKFSHDVKTGAIKVRINPGGLLLKKLGLVLPKRG